MPEDLPHHGRFLDVRDDPPAGIALGASEDVHPEGPPQKLGPGDPIGGPLRPARQDIEDRAGRRGDPTAGFVWCKSHVS